MTSIPLLRCTLMYEHKAHRVESMQTGPFWCDGKGAGHPWPPEPPVAALDERLTEVEDAMHAHPTEGDSAIEERLAGVEEQLTSFRASLGEMQLALALAEEKVREVEGDAKEEQANRYREAPFGMNPVTLCQRLLQVCDIADEQYAEMCVKRDVAVAANARAEETIVRMIGEKRAAEDNGEAYRQAMLAVHQELTRGKVPELSDMEHREQAGYGSNRLLARVDWLLLNGRNKALVDDLRARLERILAGSSVPGADDMPGWAERMVRDAIAVVDTWRNPS